ncbi:hypothetical protein PMAYCL1PPCAC_18360 [Pristionchus mayeri]|uniref:Uncharacterized protein n=1 Tax=Pristionchus mayeri TaxID=1317129 RepID=A0AAN5I1J4_9BILA|nr:hypothetical protein PMAYCL1PPCAC_18360 [Pristionchus mayeri]
MNSSDLIHNLRTMEESPLNSIPISIEEGAFTFIHSKEIYLQLHEKKAEIYSTIRQVAMARIINTITFQFGHHLTDHLQFIMSGRGFSSSFLRHLRNTFDCYRRVSDEGLVIGPEAYSYLDLQLLPDLKSKEEMYYRGRSVRGELERESQLSHPLQFFASTHPVQPQRIEFSRLFDRNEHFERTFNCTRKKPVCPNLF